MSDPDHSNDTPQSDNLDEATTRAAETQPAYTPQARTGDEEQEDDFPEKAPGFTPQARTDS